MWRAGLEGGTDAVEHDDELPVPVGNGTPPLIPRVNSHGIKLMQTPPLDSARRTTVADDIDGDSGGKARSMPRSGGGGRGRTMVVRERGVADGDVDDDDDGEHGVRVNRLGGPKGQFAGRGQLVGSTDDGSGPRFKGGHLGGDVDVTESRRGKPLRGLGARGALQCVAVRGWC